MDGIRDEKTDSETAAETDEPKLTEPVYVYTGPKFLADSKMRLAEWLERREW